MTNAAMNEIGGILFNVSSMVVWLEGGQGEVKGACNGQTLGLGGMYPPNRPTCTPPPTNPPGPPPPRLKPPQTTPPPRPSQNPPPPCGPSAND